MCVSPSIKLYNQGKNAITWGLKYKTKINIQNQKDKYIFNYATHSRACLMTFSGNILIILPAGRSDMSLIQRTLSSVNSKVANKLKMIMDLN